MTVKTKKNGKNKANAGRRAFGNKRGVKSTVNKSVKAYYTHTDLLSDPFEPMIDIGVIVFKRVKNPFGNRFIGEFGQELDEYCHGPFSLSRFEAMDFADEDEMCEYLGRYGCMAVPAYNGVTGEFEALILLDDDVEYAFGDPSSEDTERQAKELLKTGAAIYKDSQDSYDILIVDDTADLGPDTFNLEYTEDIDNLVNLPYIRGKECVPRSEVEETAKKEWELAVNERRGRLAKGSSVSQKNKKPFTRRH